jgi:hypothetical protein
MDIGFQGMLFSNSRETSPPYNPLLPSLRSAPQVSSGFRQASC